jgi:tripartite-type tricarboxylate transporter receptor subunit TctC
MADDKSVLDLLLAPQLIAYPVLAPPGVPNSRADILRDAFDATMRDPELIEDANKQKMEIELVRGEEITALLDRSYAASPAVIQKARQLTNPGR